jgi:hypothetical protein
MELLFPCNSQPQGTAEDWLEEVREMRGRVCYDERRRPWALMRDGRFRDSDPHDPRAFHLVARSRGLIVGCARFMRLTSAPRSVVASALESINIQFDFILSDLGVTKDKVFEASRWVVLPEFRGKLGRTLVAASWAVGCWLSMQLAFVLAGTRESQDVALIRMGAHPLRGIPLIPSQTFDDDLRLFYFDTNPSEVMRRQMDQAAVALKLESLSSNSPLTAGDRPAGFAIEDAAIGGLARIGDRVLP